MCIWKSMQEKFPLHPHKTNQPIQPSPFWVLWTSISILYEVNIYSITYIGETLGQHNPYSLWFRKKSPKFDIYKHLEFQPTAIPHKTLEEIGPSLYKMCVCWICRIQQYRRVYNLYDTQGRKRYITFMIPKVEKLSTIGRLCSTRADSSEQIQS